MLPAHAGMILSPLQVNERRGSAPRARGDDPVGMPMIFIVLECSPRTRG